MKKKKNLIIVAVVVVVLAILIIPRAMDKETYDEILPPTVEVENPMTGNIAVSSSLIGKIEPSEVVYINSDLGGEVQSVNVKAGDMVSAGQVLCTIENKQLQSLSNSIESARIALNNAQNAYDRTKVLYENGGVSKESFEAAESALSNAKLQYNTTVNTYDIQADNSIIVSPISGKVESCDVEVFDKVSSQNVLFVISTVDSEKVLKFSVTENIVKGLNVGDAISLEKAGTDYRGVITEVSSMVDASTGLFDVKAMIENGENLATGTSAKVWVTSDRASDVMVIPVDAVYYENGESFVYTYVDGKAKQTFIEIGLSDQNNAEVLSGLTKSDKVITTWNSELYDDAEVTLAKDKKETK
ncbi:MAG: efflux RND transporter periplasmic adaptor subunit [Anaerovoracaceae bacterium]